MLLGKQFGLAICALFLFTTFILVIVAICGSTANYKPLTNIYIGSADISHINVTKVIPQFGPILTIVGTALNSGNSSLETFFPVLHRLVGTPGFAPLLTMLSNAEDTETSVSSLVELAPLALSSNGSAAAAQQLSQVDQLLRYSTNATETLQGLESLVEASMEDPTSNSSAVVLELLKDSNDSLSSTDALLTLNNMSATEKAQLAPVFALFQVSDNKTVTFDSLATLVSSPVSGDLAQTLFLALNQSSNLTQTLQQLGSIAPENSRPALNAVGALIASSSSPNTTLSSLRTLIESNVTSSPSAQEAFTSLATLVRNGENDTLVVESVQSLATTNSTSSTEQLVSLKQLLEASNNGTGTLQVMGNLQQGLAADNSTAQYISPLVSLLESSSDPHATFTSLIAFTAWAQANPATFAPVAGILLSAQENPVPTEEQLNALTPEILQYFHVNTKYQLSIFTLCERDLYNNIQSCSASHAVQDLDFRSIIWNDLVDSDFAPYLVALNVTEDSLHLEGKLLNRQHEYVPAVEATLAFCLISIILSFFLLLAVLYLIVRRRVLGNKPWFAIIFTCLLYTLFTCLAAIIVTAIIGIIKSGTADDNYGVVFTASQAFLGLLWTSFALSLICPVLLIMAWLSDKRERKKAEPVMVENEPSANTSDSLSSSANNANSIPDPEKNNATPIVTN
ncbi:hypothetical protein HG536_0E02060 [Torulaspora globosa]|uniref:Uncharacterized protein n=1 Tax=Torulaspora globosa TaxID=48254 RepID=A0A7G3ZIF9_9SACH|nr:uncharacterized protein HG536_0E02060 [Torulaspora globosa]QLL33295.1 hypothetical protein HG536_0E02060 [Torulaspora globosa]